MTAHRTRRCLSILTLVAALLAPTASSRAQAGALALDTPVHEGDWTFQPLPQTMCRRGEPTGAVVRLAPQPTDKLLVVMQGGGACYNLATCTANPAKFGESEFRASARGEGLWLDLTEGVWDTSRPDNALSQYHQVVIPYCSGDFHAGDHDRWVDGFYQRFRGHDNTGRFFQYIVEQVVPLLSGDHPEVMLAGYSAGALGAMLNMPRLRQMLPPGVKLGVLNDSFPAFSTEIVPACLQERWHDTFGYDDTFFGECGDACAPDEWLEPYQTTMLAAYPEVPQALISSTNDSILQLYTGYFTALSLCAQDPTAEQFESALLAVRWRMWLASLWHGTPGASFFVGDSSEHAFITGDYYDPASVADGIALPQWVEGLFDGGAAQPPQYLHLGP